MHHVQGRGGLYQKSEFNSEYMKRIIFTYEGPKQVLLAIDNNLASYASDVIVRRILFPFRHKKPS
jgi:hypothetical protein